MYKRQIKILVGTIGDSVWTDNDDGFTGDGLVAKVTFSTIKTGNTTINFTPESAVIVDDGLGTNILGRIINGNYTILPAGCVENWVCSEWGQCINGTKTRTCNETNNCGTTYNKPAFTTPCLIPNISSLSPSSGLVNTNVTVRGSGFTPTKNTVNFHSVIITNLNSTDNEVLFFTVPSVTPGDYNVTVSNANGTTNSVVFTVTLTSVTTTTLLISIDGPVCGNDICESGENEITCSIDCFGVPTEQIEMEILSPNTVESGEKFTLTVRIKNSGDAGRFSLNVKDDLDITDETEIVSLSKDETLDVTFELQAPSTEGQFVVGAILSDVTGNTITTKWAEINVIYKPLILDLNYVDLEGGGTANFVVKSEDEETITIITISKDGRTIYQKKLTGASELKDDFFFKERGEYLVIARMTKGGQVVDEDIRNIFVQADALSEPTEEINYSIIIITIGGIVIISGLMIFYYTAKKDVAKTVRYSNISQRRNLLSYCC